MNSIFKKAGYRSWLTKWYIGFFTIVVIGFTSVIFFHISNQTWEKFNYGISQLGEEMLEEVMELRDDLDDDEFDTSLSEFFSDNDYDIDDFGVVNWTPDLLEEFKSGIEQEIIDESIDNHLNDICFVQISNLKRTWSRRNGKRALSLNAIPVIRRNPLFDYKIGKSVV